MLYAARSARANSSVRRLCSLDPNGGIHLETKCILCGKETKEGGYTSRIEGHVLQPLCAECHRLCSTYPGHILREYPSLFAQLAQQPTIVVSSVVKETDETPTPSITNEIRSLQPEPRPQFVRRYIDLYRAARLLVGLGNTVKGVGVSAGIGILLLFTLVVMAASNQSGALSFGMFVVGAVFGILVGGIIFLLGILISAQGQILMVQADGAIHTSPFLTDAEKLKAMSLSS
jgi:hypothetical protein